MGLSVVMRPISFPSEAYGGSGRHQQTPGAWPQAVWPQPRFRGTCLSPYVSKDVAQGIMGPAFHDKGGGWPPSSLFLDLFSKNP